jgi:hypothetical protein
MWIFGVRLWGEEGAKNRNEKEEGIMEEITIIST